MTVHELQSPTYEANHGLTVLKTIPTPSPALTVTIAIAVAVTVTLKPQHPNSKL